MDQHFDSLSLEDLAGLAFGQLFDHCPNFGIKVIDGSLMDV